MKSPPPVRGTATVPVGGPKPRRGAAHKGSRLGRLVLVLPAANTVTFPHPFVVSLSNHERSHFDKLSANGRGQ